MPIKRTGLKYVNRPRVLTGTRISVEKTWGSEGGPFLACVRIGRSGWKQGASIRKNTSACADGRNPRLAIANALSKVSAQLKHRGEHGRGAFARYR